MVTAQPPEPLPYQQYWDDEEYKAWLKDRIADLVRTADTPNAAAEAILSTLFDRISLRSWCGRPGCFGAYCQPTHYSVDVHGRQFEFAPPVAP